MLSGITLIYVFYALGGLCLLGISALKPKLFWPLLLASAILSAGLMIQGYGLVDEYLMAMISVGALLALLVGTARLYRQPEKPHETSQHYLFIVFVGYMLCQAIRGILVLNDWRVSRWLLFYLLLGLLCFFFTKKGFSLPSLSKTSLLIGIATLVYLAAYLIGGLIYEYLSQASRWDLQGFLWAGPAAAVFPLVIGLPAALFLLKQKGRVKQGLAGLVFLLGMLTVSYYETRTAAIIILLFLIVSFAKIPLKKVMVLLMIFLILTIFLAGTKPTEFTQMLFKSMLLKSQSESGRLDHLRAAWQAVNRNVTTLFFGYGAHTNRLVIGPYLEKLGYFGENPTPVIVRTTGLSGLIIDAGIVGLLLFYSQIFLAAWQVFLRKNSLYRSSLLLSLVLIAGWPLITDLQDNLLVYLLIMPAGLISYLSSSGQKETATPQI